MGPPWSKRENAFIFSENAADGIKLYYEPHCDHQEDSFSDVPSVDVVITPASDQIIANAYPLVRHTRWNSISKGKSPLAAPEVHWKLHSCC